MERILVTGGAGYIGSHACKALAMAGFEPITYDNLVYGHRSSVRWGPLEIGDIANHSRLDIVLRRWQPHAVLHFAAFAYVGESVSDPGKYYSNNVAGTLSLLEAMRVRGVMRIVFSSTCATYGIPSDAVALISEDTPQVPVNPYGTSKWIVERILEDYHHAYGMEYAALRYFNAAGADANGEIGEDHSPETHLIPLACRAVLDGIPLSIFGDDYATLDGTCVRDYVHVTDLAEAHVLALRYLLDKKSLLRCNLGTGKGYSVREVVAAVEHASGKAIQVTVSPRRAGDPPFLVADARLAGSELGWHPRFSSLEDIVTSAWQWHVNQHLATGSSG